MEECKSCYGKCDRCIWKENGGCSEWNGYKNTKTKDTKKKVNPVLGVHTPKLPTKMGYSG